MLLFRALHAGLESGRAQLGAPASGPPATLLRRLGALGAAGTANSWKSPRPGRDGREDDWVGLTKGPHTALLRGPGHPRMQLSPDRVSPRAPQPVGGAPGLSITSFCQVASAAGVPGKRPQTPLLEEHQGAVPLPLGLPSSGPRQRWGPDACARAAIAKAPHTGRSTDIYFLSFWGLDVQDQGVCRAGVSGAPPCV